jgi:hypothetical protein
MPNARHTRSWQALTSTVLLLTLGWLQSSLAASDTAPLCYVPDEVTALAVGIAVLTSLVGQPVMDRMRPFNASLSGDTWLVYSSPRPADHSGQRITGGAIHIRIDRVSGRILDWGRSP